jgi:hypothetical protein
MLTVQEVETSLPPQLKANVSQQMVDELNNLSVDPIAAENMRNNFISYTGVMKEGRFKLEDYVFAVVYVSYRVMGHTNREAYQKTFPGRYSALTARGASEKDISSYVSAYNKNKLVNLILEQSLVPVWILNQDIYQQAINTQAELMLHANSEKVRSDAANSILTHLRKPETKQIELAIDVKENTGMSEMKDQLHQMAEMQRGLIESGIATKTIAHQPLMAKSKPVEDVDDAEEVTP